LPVITEGGWHEMMRQASPSAAQSAFERHRVTPRFAASLLGREQTDSASCVAAKWCGGTSVILDDATPFAVRLRPAAAPGIDVDLGASRAAPDLYFAAPSGPDGGAQRWRCPSNP
jgi:hypothetical protein